MPPRATQAQLKMEEEIEELKKSLSFVMDEMSTLTKKQAPVAGLLKEVEALKLAVKERDKKIVELEKRLDDIEQYTRIEDVIISGVKVKPRSYAKAAAEGSNVSEDAPVEEQLSLEKQVIDFFNTKDIEVDPLTIAACHTLPRKDADPAIIIRFANRRDKTDLLKQGKKLKGSDVYINEHLTKKNAEIAKEARSLRKRKKIQSTWTRSCKVMIKLNGDTPEQAKVLMIKDLKELDKYK